LSYTPSRGHLTLVRGGEIIPAPPSVSSRWEKVVAVSGFEFRVSGFFSYGGSVDGLN